MKSLLHAETEIIIPFHDVDPMQITWHGNYLRYFEIVRCELLDKLDYNYRQMQESGFAWPIVDVQIKYVRSSTFGQKIRVSADLVEWENRLRINYQVRDAESGERLTKGYTIQAAVDMSNNELCFVTPEVFQAKIRPLLGEADA
ncbi:MULTISPECIES: acyl-CoA thioesterase [Shewanella]|uniref:Acyl-CoA thioesterase n=1 Tax=Shewanella zhuhaiensis TaxID=2919576 RepID=A0AAJ1BIA2_9GAMM|nr:MULTISPECIES: acyl-CoA thioesterase [Shewanella]MCH4295284.1 acyl-CoA thioesterase [Shewanella zhuhaiensis]QYJ75142.1 acyl-CoA thioesterase [Shewanella sp. FJAT-52076]QYK05011.1 acyl-CoA thioesterase [Shewanella zhangzhouensis]